jgi:hypothetical protein
MGFLIVITVLYSTAFMPLALAQKTQSKKTSAIIGLITSLMILAAYGWLLFVAFASGQGSPRIPIYMAIGFAIICSIWALRIFTGKAADLLEYQAPEE